ncbi:hypothetical protein GGF39_003911 [Coemansia sp. RSA 1721]|nr:hypothetical protein GGF39_003911 [Coemansia sp. RSA 1721]
MSRTINTAADGSGHSPNSLQPLPRPRHADVHGTADGKTDNANDEGASTAEYDEQSYPSRCESPLLPMGQTASYQIDPDRLSQQLGKHGHRQSQHSVMYKNYALRDDDDENDLDTAAGNRSPAHDPKSGFRRRPTGGSRRTNTGLSTESRSRYYMRRPKTLLRPKSYRIGGSSADAGQTSPVKEFSSKIKSACRKLNPKRLTKSVGAHRDGPLQSGEPHDNGQARPENTVGLAAASSSSAR